MSNGISLADDATYSLVDRNGELWPAVHCADDMIPAHELEVRPAGYYRAVLLLAIFEFKWVLSSEIFEFDPSASQRIPDGPHKVQLRAAFDSVLGSPSLPGHSQYPDLGFWRSELLARDLENTSSDSDDAPTLRTPTRHKNITIPTSKDVKRPWSMLKLEKDFGYANKKNKTEHKKKNSGSWFPDEDDSDEVNAPPPRGYFEKLKKEHDQVQKLRNLAILDTNSEGSSSTEDDSEDGSDSENSDEEERKPVQRPQAKIRKETTRDASTSPSSRTLSSRSTAAPKPANTKLSTAKQQQDCHQPAVTQLCKQLDTARRSSHWDDASAVATQLLTLTPWSDSTTLLIARTAFRAAPRPDVEGGFEHRLRVAVAEQVALHYERLRANSNSMVAIVLRDHRELAKMVYERRLEAVRRKEIEVVEIESD